VVCIHLYSFVCVDLFKSFVAMSNVENDPAVANAPVGVKPTTKEKEKKEQNLWKPMEKTTLKDGKQIVWHTFVHESNLKDKLLLSHLLSAQPMHAGHGVTTTIWEQMVTDINCENGFSHNPLLFVLLKIVIPFL
jgi:hypothetical protein